MQIRTDLAMESRDFSGFKNGVSSFVFQHGSIEEIHVNIDTNEAAEALSKSCGKYITLTHGSLLYSDMNEKKKLSQILAETVESLLPHDGDILVIGLGNRHITADALGSRVLDHLLITRHMKEITDQELRGRLRSVCAVAPGVLGITGIETAEMVQGIVKKINPAAVIAIDALAARDSSRICTTIQITDTGICPGSGVGNHRIGLTKDTLGIPVIAIGVPMVVYASVIARDALTKLLDDIGMNAAEHERIMDELIERVSKQGMKEMVVTPREVDELVGKVARIIARGLNMALQPALNEDEINVISHDGMA